MSQNDEVKLPLERKAAPWKDVLEAEDEIVKERNKLIKRRVKGGL